MANKKADYFMLAVVPNQQPDICAFNHHRDEFDESTGLFHEYDEDLPRGLDNIKQALKQANITPDEGDRVVAYALVPIREYEVVVEHGFRLVLQESKKKKGGKK